MSRIQIKYYAIRNPGGRMLPELDYCVSGGFGVAFPKATNTDDGMTLVEAPRYSDFSDDLRLPWFPESFREITRDEYASRIQKEKEK